jgi:hypothetical protein
MKYSALLSPKGYAAGGIAAIDGRRIRGNGDGMSDSIPAVVDDREMSSLSSNEYVISADIVSFLGNGDSEAGARVLDEMVARIRKAKTGSSQQPPQIDPAAFLPA